jgi:hypothetical protein
MLISLFWVAVRTKRLSIGTGPTPTRSGSTIGAKPDHFHQKTVFGSIWLPVAVGLSVCNPIKE